MNWYLRCWEHYADFKGRARRKEYWMFALFNFIVVVVLTILDSLLGWVIPEIGVGALGIVYTLAAFIPGLAVVVRRLHDIGKSGWCYLIAFSPLLAPYSFWFGFLPKVYLKPTLGDQIQNLESTNKI